MHAKFLHMHVGPRASGMCTGTVASRPCSLILTDGKWAGCRGHESIDLSVGASEDFMVTNSRNHSSISVCVERRNDSSPGTL